MKSVYGKLGTMKKVVDWSVYPPSEGEADTLWVQCDRRICKINTVTKKGWLSKSCYSPGFMMASKFLGATEVEVPQTFIDECLGAQPQKGDEIAPGIIIG